MFIISVVKQALPDIAESEKPEVNHDGGSREEPHAPPVMGHIYNTFAGLETSRIAPCDRLIRISSWEFC